MSKLQIIIVLAVFSAVILTIAFNVIDMAVAALVGVCVLILLGILNEQDLLSATDTAGGPIGLLFGGVIVARILSTPGIFALIGDIFLRATGGSGRRFLLLLIALLAPVCAFLPNATAVVLLPPLMLKGAVSPGTDL